MNSDLPFPKTDGATKSRFLTVVFDSFRKTAQLERIENNVRVKKKKKKILPNFDANNSLDVEPASLMLHQCLLSVYALSPALALTKQKTSWGRHYSGIGYFGTTGSMPGLQLHCHPVSFLWGLNLRGRPSRPPVARDRQNKLLNVFMLLGLPRTKFAFWPCPHQLVASSDYWNGAPWCASRSRITRSNFHSLKDYLIYVAASKHKHHWVSIDFSSNIFFTGSCTTTKLFRKLWKDIRYGNNF